MADRQTETKRIDRSEKGMFLPGNKGGGRPAVAKEFKERCKDFMSAHGWINLTDMATDAESPHRYRANELIAAYAYGKPTQPVSGDDSMPALLIQVAGLKVPGVPNGVDSDN